MRRTFQAFIVILMTLVMIGGAVSPAMASQNRGSGSLRWVFMSGSATGGKPITIRITLWGEAPAGGARVLLMSSKEAVKVPGVVTIPAGESEVLVKVRTFAVTENTSVVVTARLGDRTRRATHVVLRPYLSSTTVQTRINSGSLGKITVRLSGIAPEGGVTVKLNSNRPSVLPVPSTVYLPAGKASVSINVPATKVRRDVNVNVTALYRGIKITKPTIVRKFVPTVTEEPTATATATADATGTASDDLTATAISDDLTATAEAELTATQESSDQTATAEAELTATQASIDLTATQTSNDETATASADQTATQAASDLTATRTSDEVTATQQAIDATATQIATDQTATQVSIDQTATQVSIDATATQEADDATSTAEASATQVSIDQTATQVSIDLTATQQASDEQTATAIAWEQTATAESMDATATQAANEATATQQAVDATATFEAGQPEVMICHMIGKDTYNGLSLNRSGIVNGHLGTDSGDIIPPFEYKGQFYSQNWDEAGQAIYYNACSPEVPTATETEAAPTATSVPLELKEEEAPVQQSMSIWVDTQSAPVGATVWYGFCLTQPATTDVTITWYPGQAKFDDPANSGSVTVPAGSLEGGLCASVPFSGLNRGNGAPTGTGNLIFILSDGQVFAGPDVTFKGKS